MGDSQPRLFIVDPRDGPPFVDPRAEEVIAAALDGHRAAILAEAGALADDVGSEVVTTQMAVAAIVGSTRQVVTGEKETSHLNRARPGLAAFVGVVLGVTSTTFIDVVLGANLDAGQAIVICGSAALAVLSAHGLARYGSARSR